MGIEKIQINEKAVFASLNSGNCHYSTEKPPARMPTARNPELIFGRN